MAPQRRVPICRQNSGRLRCSARLSPCGLTTSEAQRASDQPADADGAPVHYERHRPEQTTLYRRVQQHGAQAQDAAGADLPQFVEDEFDAFLECGTLAFGSLRLRCGDCGHDKLVAFSCWRCGFCPSCAARRMAQTAAHQVNHVIPRVPVRQWVLSVPIPVRLVLAAQPKLVTPVLQMAHPVITRYLLGQAGIKSDEADSGVDTNDDDSDEARAQAAASRSVYVPHRLRPACWPEGVDATGRHAQTEGVEQSLCADIDGFRPHAAVRCGADDRQALAQLCRSITRPALANERVQTNAAGQALPRLKTPWRDGTTHLVMSPLEFTQRPAALVPRPRRYLNPLSLRGGARRHAACAGGAARGAASA